MSRPYGPMALWPHDPMGYGIGAGLYLWLGQLVL